MVHVRDWKEWVQAERVCLNHKDDSDQEPRFSFSPTCSPFPWHRTDKQIKDRRRSPPGQEEACLLIRIFSLGFGIMFSGSYRVQTCMLPGRAPAKAWHHPRKPGHNSQSKKPTMLPFYGNAQTRLSSKWHLRPNSTEWCRIVMHILSCAYLLFSFGSYSMGNGCQQFPSSNSCEMVFCS